MNPTSTIPAAPLHILDRDRLMNRLLSWEDRKLVIIHGQAGQGKTTLAASYVRTLACPSLWHTMGPAEIDPYLFLGSLGQTIRNARPSRTAGLPALQDRHGIDGPLPDAEAWVRQALSSPPGPSLFVIDDCHHASSSPSLLRILQTLIDRTPPQVRFILLTRTRLDLQVARLRTSQLMGELTNEDLTFNASEVHDLFTQAFHMQVSEQEAALISGSTEGWPAGLALMHEYLSLIPPEARHPAITCQRPAEFHDQVFDYLAQEVFEQLSIPLQQFLLRTSVPDVLPLPLITLLTDIPQSAPAGKLSIASMTRELLVRNLFTASMDNNGPAIRYHALFREFLRKKLTAKSGQQDVARLYTIAADYFHRANDPVRSIDLLLANGQLKQAVKRIELSGEAMISRGLTRTLIRWIDALPSECHSRPWSLLFRAAANRFTEPRTALQFYELALTQFRRDRTAHHRASGSMHALCGVIEACFHGSGDFTHMARMTAKAHALLAMHKREPPRVRARLLLAMGTAWFFIGRLEQAARALKQALALFRKHGDHLHQITCSLYLTPCLLYQGDFRAARMVVRTGFESLAAIPDETGSTAALHLIRAMAELFEGNFGEAQKSLDQCKDLADLHALGSIGLLSLDIAGWLTIAQGDYRGAEVLLTDLKRKGAAAQNAFFIASASHLLSITYLFQRKFDAAKSESEHALSIPAQNGSRLFQAVYLIANGAIHMKRGSLQEAEKDLRTSLAMLKQAGAAHQEANAHLVLALLYKARNRPDLVRKHLHAGFSLGQSKGFTYYALFDAVELSELADDALARDICTGYCSALRERLAATRPAPHLHVHCLGTFRVVRDRSPIPDAQWKSKPAKSLLKLLVAHLGRKLPKERVMDLLWPAKDASRLRPAFNSTLHRARKVLGSEVAAGRDIFCMHQESDVMALNSALVWTDVGQFLSHLDNAARMKARQDHTRIVEEYEKAIALYKGDFLPDDLYAEWTGPMREQLRMRYLKALGHAAALMDTAGDRARSLAFQETMFRADPANEEACCWLMARYLSDNRRNDAIRTYEQCERALAQDMDLEPEEKTRKLYRSIIGR